MTEIANLHSSEERTQRFYARVAGFVLLFLLINGLVNIFILSHIAGSETFAETASKIATSERLYRVALSGLVIENLSGGLLAFALYVTLKPVNNLVALLAMICNLVDSSLGLVVRMFAFVRLHLYTSSQSVVASGTIAAQSLLDLTRIMSAVMENIGGILFGLGTLLFFYLFFKSNYIPRILSALGVFASAIWISLYFASLIFPERRPIFQYICFPLMAIAEVSTGFYLMLFAINHRGEGDQSNQPAISHSEGPD